MLMDFSRWTFPISWSEVVPRAASQIEIRAHKSPVNFSTRRKSFSFLRWKKLVYFVFPASRKVWRVQGGALDLECKKKRNTCKHLLDNILSVSAEAKNYYPLHIFSPIKQGGDSKQFAGPKCKRFLHKLSVISVGCFSSNVKSKLLNTLPKVFICTSDVWTDVTVNSAELFLTCTPALTSTWTDFFFFFFF